MDDAFLAWARRQIEEWDARIPWLETGRITTGEMREGQRIDTTEESVSDLRRWSAELRELIAKHEARRA